MIKVKALEDSKERADAVTLISNCLISNGIGIHIGTDAMLSMVLWALFEHNDKEVIKDVLIQAVEGYAAKKQEMKCDGD